MTGASSGSGLVCSTLPRWSLFCARSPETFQDLGQSTKLMCVVGSSHGLYLGASARIARLQAEHLRLSINAMALRSSTRSDGHESSVMYLRKALNAAKSTIQTHFESSQTDLALSFATDVSLRFSLLVLIL